MRRSSSAGYELLGDWVDVDNQLARIAPVLVATGLWVRFMRDAGVPTRLRVVNPATGPAHSVHAELTVARMDGPAWIFMYHSAPDVLPLALGVNAHAAASRVAHLLAVVSERAEEQRR